MRMMKVNGFLMKFLPLGVATILVLTALHRTLSRDADLDVQQRRPSCHRQTTNSHFGSHHTNQVFISWSYTSSVPLEAKENVGVLTSAFPNATFNVYCGSTMCLKTFTRIKSVSAKVFRLQVLDLARGTPLENWMRRHAIHKVMAGSKFEQDLQNAVRLCLMWRYGGLHVDPYLNVKFPVVMATKVSVDMNDCIMVSGRMAHSMQLCRTTARSPFISAAMESFLFWYDDIIKNRQRHPLQSIQAPQYPYDDYPACSGTVSPLVSRRQRVLSAKKRFGLLSYDLNIRRKSGNIGDEVQALATAHFIPRVNAFIDRDDTRGIPECNCTLIGNAYWPHKSVLPVLGDYRKGLHLLPVSIHLDQIDERKWEADLNGVFGKHFRSQGTVGARDVWTFDFLQKHGVSVVLTGCLTLFLQSPFTEANRSDDIYLVDYSRWAALGMLPFSIITKATSISHGSTRDPARFGRFRRAAELLDLYARAKLVITTRLHVALPCVAFGTPVIFVNSRKLFGANKKVPSSRVMGLLPLFHTVDLYKLTLSEARKKLAEFNYDSPPPNPNERYKNKLKQRAWELLSTDVDVRETALTFGLINPSQRKVSFNRSRQYTGLRK